MDKDYGESSHTVGESLKSWKSKRPERDKRKGPTKVENNTP